MSQGDFINPTGGPHIYLGSGFTVTALTSQQRQHLMDPGFRRPHLPTHNINPYVSSLNMAGALIQRYFNISINRQIAHVPYLLNRYTHIIVSTWTARRLKVYYRRVLSDMWRSFPEHLQAASSHRYRTEVDFQFQLLYYGYLIARKKVT